MEGVEYSNERNREEAYRFKVVGIRVKYKLIPGIPVPPLALFGKYRVCGRLVSVLSEHPLKSGGCEVHGLPACCV